MPPTFDSGPPPPNLWRLQPARTAREHGDLLAAGLQADWGVAEAAGVALIDILKLEALDSGERLLQLRAQLHHLAAPVEQLLARLAAGRRAPSGQTARCSDSTAEAARVAS